MGIAWNSLSRSASHGFTSLATQQSPFRRSRVADAPNSRSSGAFAPWIVQPGIVHRNRYLLCIATSLPMLRTFHLQTRIPSLDMRLGPTHPISFDTGIRKMRINAL